MVWTTQIGSTSWNWCGTLHGKCGTCPSSYTTQSRGPQRDPVIQPDASPTRPRGGFAVSGGRETLPHRRCPGQRPGMKQPSGEGLF